MTLAPCLQFCEWLAHPELWRDLNKTTLEEESENFDWAVHRQIGFATPMWYYLLLHFLNFIYLFIYLNLFYHATNVTSATCQEV